MTIRAIHNGDGRPRVVSNLSNFVTLSVALCSVLTACDITHVAEPSVTEYQNLENPQGAAALRAGALGAFAVQLSYQTLWTGLLTDEFGAVPVYATSYTEDRRAVTVENNYPYGGLSAARLNAVNALSVVKQYAPQPAWQIAELYSYLATTEIVFSENLCNGVPLGQTNGSTVTYGPTYTRVQLLTQALVDLDSASNYTSGSDSIASLVAVLRGRALLDSGAYTSAAASVTAVPVSFVYPIWFTTTGANQPNWIYEYIHQYRILTVSDREGTNGLPFVSANDPRVPTIVVSAAVVAPINPSSASAPMTLASGIEAQLIVAEAALAAGQTMTWASILNNLRQTAIVPAMPAIPADSTTGATPELQLAVQFRERAFWLFATGHRQGDLRRLIRQYHLSTESVFPTGLYEGGPQSYGTAVVFPPAGESYNGSYAGCIDLNA